MAQVDGVSDPPLHPVCHMDARGDQLRLVTAVRLQTHRLYVPRRTRHIPPTPAALVDGDSSGDLESESESGSGSVSESESESD